MALSRVQATPKGNSSTTTLTLTFAAPPVVGNGIIVTVLGKNELPGPASCTDNYGNAYQLVTQANQGLSPIATIYFCPAVVTTGSGFAVTVTLGASFRSLTGNAIEVGGTGGQLRVDRSVQVIGSSATGTTITSGVTSALRTTGQTIVVAALGLGIGESAITAQVVSPTWTQEFEELTAGNAACTGEGDSRILSAVGGTTQSATWTIATASSWCAALACFGSAAEVPIPELRATQVVTEALTHPTPAPLTTQLAVETLTHPTPVPLTTQLVVETITSGSLLHGVDARTTQLVVETITQLIPPRDARVTQLLAETLTKLPPVPPLVTQLLVESITHLPPSIGRVSQIPLELLDTPPAAARLAQAPLELLDQRDAPHAAARLSQSPLELAAQRSAPGVHARVSQAALEILYPFGCYKPPCTGGEFPLDAVADASGCDQLLVIADAGLGSVCGTEGGGTPPPPLPRIPAGAIMVGGWGDAHHCVFLSPDGATTYPPVGDWPSTQVDVSAFCRLTTGDIALVGGNAPQFPESGSGVLKASDLSTLSQYTGDRPGQFAIAADALGNWYTFRLGGSTGFFTRMNAASAQTGAWDIALGVYADSQVWAMAISADGLTAYVWLQAGVFGSDPTRFNYHILVCSLAGAGALGAVLTTDYNYQAPSAGSLLVVPGSGDIIAGFRHLNGSSTVTAPSVIRRYTPAGALVWTATFPAGAADWATWMYLAHGVPGSTHFLAYAYDDIDTSSSARYTWFSYATGAPDNTRNFAPDAGSFEFDSQFVVLATDIL